MTDEEAAKHMIAALEHFDGRTDVNIDTWSIRRRYLPVGDALRSLLRSMGVAHPTAKPEQ